MAGKSVEGSSFFYYRSICLEELRKSTKASVWIACLRAEILTRDLPNTKEEC
jgi:hypothetical protein